MTRYKRFEDIPNEAELNRYRRLSNSIDKKAELDGVLSVTDQDLEDLAILCPTEAQNLRKRRAAAAEAAKTRQRAKPRDPLDDVVTVRLLMNTLRAPGQQENHFARMKDVFDNLDPVIRRIGQRLDALESSINTASGARPAMSAPDPAPARLRTLEDRIKTLEQRPSLEYQGVFAPATRYKAGDCVTWGGSMWVCRVAGVRGTPGEDFKGWQLAVKRGAEAKQASK